MIQVESCNNPESWCELCELKEHRKARCECGCFFEVRDYVSQGGSQETEYHCNNPNCKLKKKKDH